MGVQMVADPDQALSLAVERRIRKNLHRARPILAVRRAAAWAVRHGPSGSTHSRRLSHQVICHVFLSDKMRQHTVFQGLQ